MQKSERRIAEWVTLIVSILVVGGLAIFLVIGALKPRSEFVALQAKVQESDIVQRGENYLLPVELVNASRRSVSTATVEVSFDDGKERATRDITFDYLASGATQRALVAFARDPRELKVHARVAWYQID